MNCNEIRNHILAYLDSELDARTSQEIQLHLQSCAGCAQLFAREEKFNERVFKVLRAGQPTPALWQKLESGLRPERRGVLARIANLLGCGIPFRRSAAKPGVPEDFDAPPVGNRRPGRWQAGATVAATLVVALALAWFTSLSAAPPFDLAQAVAKDHGEFIEGKMKPEFTGALPENIAAQLDGRLDAAAFGALPAKNQFHPEGARRCNLQGVPAAWTVGHCGDVPVSVIVFKIDELSRFPNAQARLESGEPIVCARTGRFQFAVRYANGHVVCAIAATSREKLETLLRSVAGTL